MPPELLGYREHDEPGLASRTMWVEYGGVEGSLLHFRLFGTDPLRECAQASGWELAAIERRPNTPHYLAAVEKS